MNKSKFILTTAILVIGLTLVSCQYFDSRFSPTETPRIPSTASRLDTTSESDIFSASTPTNIPTPKEPVKELAFISKCCECNKADVSLMTFPSREVTVILSNQENIYRLAWSPNGKMLSVLSDDTKERVFRVIDMSTQEISVELRDDILEFAWFANGDGIFYLDQNEALHWYNLRDTESTILLEGVSNFSVSPDGNWLGVSVRESKEDTPYFGYFTFRVLNLKNGDLLMSSDRTDLGRLGSNQSVWSPTSNYIAVLFGPLTAQSSKIVIYTVQPIQLEVKSSIIARETYQHDFGQDLVSIEFTDLTWSPDGESLLVIRSVSDAQPGGEALLFDTSTWNYGRLSLGENITNFAWASDNDWLAYTKADNRNASCKNQLAGEIWLTDIHKLEPQLLLTDTIHIAQPVWRP